MATISEARALPFFSDLYGLPLESGSIYIGQPGLDPVAYPTTVSSDYAGTVVLQQPIRTMHGRAVSAGAQVHLYCAVPYSITVLDSAGRVVYASLSETDPILTAFTNSSVQSAPDLPTLRARTGASTNQIWVAGFGMYVYIPTDNTSPENVPFVIVGNDGSRYYLNSHYVFANWARFFAAASPTQQGLWASWNDDASGSGFITNNRGTGPGGIVLRNVNANNTAEIGRVTVTAVGGINATSDIRSNGNLIAQGGVVALDSAGDRSLQYDGTNYQLPSSDLFINGAKSITLANLQAAILANQQANGIGAVALGTNGSPNPPLAGAWALTGSSNNSVFLWVRVT